MRVALARQVSVVGRIAVAVLVVLAGLAARPRTVSAQGTERLVMATAECEPAAEDAPAGIVSVRIANDSGLPLRVIAVAGINTPQSFQPELARDHVDLVTSVGGRPLTIPNGRGGAVSWSWDERRAMEGEGFAGGAIVVTNLGVLTPLCTPNPADAGELALTDPLPRTDEETRLQEARYMAETLGRLEGWRVYPLLHALLHPDAQEAVGLDRLACWYVGAYGSRLDPDRLDIFTTTVSVAEVEPWAWPVTGEEYETAVPYDYEQEVGTISETETVSGNAHLVLEDGVWRWFFGTSQAGLDALPETCGG